MAKTSFNSDFYVVCATVIPVFFLAIAVQGDAYKTLLETAIKKAVIKPNDGWWCKQKAIILPVILQQLAYWIGVAGIGGEILALLALYRGKELPGNRSTLFACMLVLLFAVAIGPLHAQMETRKRVLRQLILPEAEQAHPTGNQNVDGSGKCKPTSNETFADKADRFTLKVSGLGWPEKRSSGLCGVLPCPESHSEHKRFVIAPARACLLVRRDHGG